MFGITHYEMFLLTCLIVNITPGPDTLYVVSRSIAQGRRAGIYSLLGISSGCAIHTLLAALGLSVILMHSAMAFMAVKTLGALYLAYLGLAALLSKDNLILSRQGELLSAKDMYIQGLLTNVLNPKVAIFFLSLLPQFVDPQSPDGVMPFILLGMTFITTGTFWMLLLVSFSATFTAVLRKSEKTAKWLNKICGSIYLLLSAKLLTSER